METAGMTHFLRRARIATALAAALAGAPGAAPELV
jgi:hypothetical protein